MDVIAKEIATYLQSLGEGTLGTDLFFDNIPEIDPDALAVYDTGGTPDSEPPEAWREVYIQFRCKTHATGYEKIWRVLNHLLYPATGVIQVGTNQYIAQLQEIPAIFDKDHNQRYIFSFSVIINKIADVNDTWMETLAMWSETTLGAAWTVYRVWPKNKRPSVVWRLVNIQIADRGNAMFEVQKRFIGQILGNTPNDLITGATVLAQELGTKMKLELDAVNRRYLKISNVTSDIRVDQLTFGQLSLTLSRFTNRPVTELPLMTKVNNTPSIQ